MDDLRPGADAIDRAHDLEVDVLLAVSSHAVAGQSLMDFYSRLARTMGELVSAEKVLFWRLGDDNMLAPLASGYGVDKAFLSSLSATRCEPGGDDLASQVVHHDLIFRANNRERPAEFANVLETLGVSSAISVPWRAGDIRLGLVAAYDSTRPGLFSRQDSWVLQKAGLGASGIAHEVVLEIPEDMSLDLKTTVFRQLSEAISNVERHSEAKRVKVSLTVEDGGVLGVIEDDGQGFVVSERSNIPGHLGLL